MQLKIVKKNEKDFNKLTGSDWSLGWESNDQIHLGGIQFSWCRGGFGFHIVDAKYFHIWAKFCHYFTNICNSFTVPKHCFINQKTIDEKMKETCIGLKVQD